MKHLRQSCLIAALACALAASTYAGDMSAGYTNPPPPPAQPTGETAQPNVATDEASDEVLETALMLLQGALSVL